MSLRVTQNMLYARALSDIRNSSRGMIDLQEQVATGRRINRPSDDPSAMLRLLPLKAEMLDFENLSDNAHLAAETLDTAASALEEASSTMARLEELLVQASNGTVSNSDRKSIGVEVDQLLRHMVGIANSRRGDSFLFGGTRTDSVPFELDDNKNFSRVRYRGASESHEITVAPGVETTLYSGGDRYFQGINRERTIIDGKTGAKSMNASDTGRGFGELEISFGGIDASTLPTGVAVGTATATSTALGPLSYTYSPGAGTLSIGGSDPVTLPVVNGRFVTKDEDVIYLDAATPISPATGTILAEADLSTDGGKTSTRFDFSTSSVSLKNSYDESILNVDLSDLKRTGKDKVTFPGTFDVFTVMIAARDALRIDDELDPDAGAKRLRQLIGEASTAHDTVLTGLQEIGIRGGNLELLQNRLANLITSDAATRSNIEDADLAESITAMTQKQFNFQASLQVSARIVQTSLLQFLR